MLIDSFPVNFDYKAAYYSQQRLISSLYEAELETIFRNAFVGKFQPLNF
jgi:hypothetical protein